MTMIITAHLGDCILIAADKRAMSCNLETGQIKLANDNEQKIKLWNRGAIAGTGETIFLDRVADYFIQFKKDEYHLKQLDRIYDEIEKRMLEGIPPKVLYNNCIMFSMFNGVETLLHSIPIEPFFHVIEKNDRKIIQPKVLTIKAYDVDVTCFNLPPDMSNLQEFQRNLKALSDFTDEKEFVFYYIRHLKKIFATHAQVDPSITTSFDLYLQSCVTGRNIAIHVPSLILPSVISDDLNYWNRMNNI
ncbi:hypothetical protein P7L54_19840 [Acinetobacter bereziniae]|uniref:Uncharacterized protein n=1 Tax=Acinetobacter bereziniae LMG 1003 = CIP 70.12 TaxID=981324 RepID=N9E8P4_ACIBZ|nr:hypothetical protein [Acinetobacter bereziniae]ENV91314.1 hypothetical protein F938_03818 [Acinetobacter bereziniae LMG 1003 = CIP 70.12]MBJ9907541.1 hypothetical protein [Acinetobacter bereziniae]MBJ9930160.1 hypothetical protein [Acinetobacter bereziniae]MDG3558196.1 hypothetical protein [Acinetobacter bereziniae]MDP6000963.1 hypothetical protein [Acinetobacter bereziniae]